MSRSKTGSFCFSSNNCRVTSTKDAHYCARERTYAHYEDTVIAIGMQRFVLFLGCAAIFVPVSPVPGARIARLSRNERMFQVHRDRVVNWIIAIDRYICTGDVDDSSAAKGQR